METKIKEVSSPEELIERLNNAMKLKEALKGLGKFEAMGKESCAFNLFNPTKEDKDAHLAFVTEYVNKIKDKYMNLNYSNFEYNCKDNTMEVSYLTTPTVSVKEYKTKKAALKAGEATKHIFSIIEYAKDKFSLVETELTDENIEENITKVTISLSLEEFTAKWGKALEMSGLKEAFEEYLIVITEVEMRNEKENMN